MNDFVKTTIAVFLNCTLFTNQLLADLPPITFDSAEWEPYQTVGQDPASGWQLLSGNSVISPNGEGFNGGRALKIPANVQGETRLSRTVSWNPADSTAFIDLQVKPAADPVGSLASIYANGTQIAFQVPDGSSTGEIWVYQGNDGCPTPEAHPEQWIRTVGSFSVPPGTTASSTYIRITMRHDYQRNLWDLFIDGKLAAANLSFEGRGTNLQSLEFYGSIIGDTCLDNLSAQSVNMLFPDADKDGLSDAWEIANGSNPNLYDRDAIEPGTGKSFLDLYLASLWPQGAINTNSGLAPSVAIPALSILGSHQPVGALKGGLTVAGDGSSSYSVPIDLPKGTAGMEPRLSLNYSSNGGNGITGVGWSLSGLQRITRGPSSVVKDGSYDPMDFDASDRFFLDGERLVCVAGTYGAAGSEYRTEMDSYSRITAIGNGPVSWKIETKAGLMVNLGTTADSRIEVPQGVLSWGVNQVADTLGNYYSVEYARNAENSNQRVSAMHYTGNASQGLAPYCHVLFDYETRPDTSTAYTTYAGYQLSQRLAKIRVLTGDFVNHSYRLGYTPSYQTGRSMLTSIAKCARDDSSLMVPPTTFNYDGIQAGEPIWRDPGNSQLPIYSINLDATGTVNSMVTSEDNNTTIRLTGDVSRAYAIPLVNIQADTMIQFDFKSDLLTNGAVIGLDSDAVYQMPFAGTQTNLYRIGGTGNIRLAPDKFAFEPYFKGPTQPYTAGQGWKTFTLNATQFGTGSKGNLVLICADDAIADGTSEALLRNVSIYNSATQQPSDVTPVVFNLNAELPRFGTSDGKDLGVTSLDLNADGLPDLADWRAINFTTTNNITTPVTTGNAYRNTGNGFVMDNSLRPPAALPLSVRPTDDTTYAIANKHNLLGRPVDVNGDGVLDLLASVNIRSLPDKIMTNEYTFYTWNGSAWVRMTATYDLPFRIENTSSNTSNGGKNRVEHFEWVDLNSDGYQDLVVYTTAQGRLYDKVTNALIAGASSSVAYINNGKNGPGWTRDDSYKLPEPLMVDQKDVGRRLVDIDGDGVVEMAESSNKTGNLVAHTYRMNASSGNYRWNSTRGLSNPPVDRYDLPVALDSKETYISSGLVSTAMMMDLNGDGLVDILGSSYGSLSFLANSEPEYQLYQLGATDEEVDIYLTTGVVPSWILLQFSNNARINVGNLNSSPWMPMLSYNIEYPFVYWKNSTALNCGYEAADINGDGLVDVFYSNMTDNLTFLNTGSGWLKRTEWGAPGTNRIFTSPSNRDAGKRSSKLQDINGDGFPDLVTDILGNTPRVWYNNFRPEVLKSVTDGFGSELTVNYKRLNDPTPVIGGFGSRVYEKNSGTLPNGQNAIIDSRLVVASYTEPNASGGVNTRYQRYGDLRYDRFNESSLGFGWIEAMDGLTGQISRTETSQVFPSGGSPVYSETRVPVTSADLSSRLPGVTVGMKVLETETSTYAELPSQTGIGGTIRRPVQTVSVKCLYDLNESLKSRTITTQNLADFDAYGFVKNSTVTALDGSTVTTGSTYAHNVSSSKWQLGRLSQATVTKSGGGKATIAKSSSFTYNSAAGLLTSETVEPGNALSVSKSYTHDGFGNVISTVVTTGGQTRSGTTIYDPSGRFVLAEKNQLNHTVSYSYDAARALLQSTTSASGLTSSFQYDAFGTLILTNHPDGTQTGEITGWATAAGLPSSVAALATSVKYFRAKQSSGSPVTKVYLDAQGREIIAETTLLRDAATGTCAQSYTHTVYDARNRKSGASFPFAAGEAPSYTFITYDFLNRIINTAHPDGTSEYAEIFGTDTLTSGPATYSKTKTRDGKSLERWEDQHGRLVQSKDPSGQTTTFTHDHEGRLLTVAIAGQTLLTNIYDIFGNKTAVNEVNSGTSTSTYNGFGEVVSSTNAKGQTSAFNYDILGRPATITKPEGTFTTTYDGAPGNGLGKPWKTTGPDGYQESIAYDSYGRPLTTTKTQFGETFTTSTSYDALGRVYSETDAGGLTVLHEYHPTYSFPTALKIGMGLPGAGTYLWKAGTFDSRGRAISQTLAQGVTTQAAYHPASGLLTTLSAARSGETLQNKTCTWDSLGNLTSREDLIARRTESFQYDNLNRVTSSTTALLSGAVITTLPPPETYTYATNGNLLTKPRAALTYSGTRPHAVTSATIKGVTRAYTYDAAGYVTADGKRTYTWSSSGQLKSLDYLSAPDLQNLAGIPIFAAARVQTDFTFDAGGNRARQIKQRINADDTRILEETLYLGSYEREIHSTKASAAASPVVTKTVHRHSIGGFATYTKTDIPGTAGSLVRLSTILKDHLGSTDVILTSTWNGTTFANSQTEKQSFNPWGERRAADTQVTYRATDADPFHSSAQDYDRGYTGHEQLDDSGLIHMNGRIYDPELGRMLSPDPVVQVPEFSQNFNRYSYVLNNPLNLTDPTGFSWLSNAFHKAGHWLHENWRTVVTIVIGAILMFTPGGQAFLGSIVSGIYTGITGAASIAGMAGGLYTAGMAAVSGAIMGGLNAALAGGGLGDVLRGAVVGAISGAITGGVLNNTPNYLVRVAGHGVVGGASNAALGGKFQDGFISAAAGQAFPSFQLGNSPLARAVSSGVIGGTASALGGGKFANGAFTSAFMRLMSEMTTNSEIVNRDSNQTKWFYPDGDPGLSEGVDGHGINGSEDDSYYQNWADRSRVAVFHIYSEGGPSGMIQDIGEVIIERLFGGFGSKQVDDFISGFEKLQPNARLNIITHSQGVSPVVGAMFRRPDLFSGVNLDARSSSVYALRIELATRYSGSSYTWSMPSGPDIANVYSSMNPLKIFEALGNPGAAIRNHSNYSVDRMRGY